MTITISDADVTTRKGETSAEDETDVERIALTRHVVRSLLDQRLWRSYDEPYESVPESSGLNVSGSADAYVTLQRLRDSWRQLSELESTLSKSFTRMAAFRTSSLLSEVRATLEAWESADSGPRGVYSPHHDFQVLFTQELVFKTSELPRLKPRVRIYRRSLERNDAE